MTTSASSTGGYKVRNIAEFERKYRCLVCSNLLKIPVQLGCGHRTCKICIQTENNYVQCSECEEKTILSEIQIDKGFHKDMQILNVSCIACEWSGQLKIYQEHLEQSHGEFKCPNCSEIFNSIPLLKEHIEKLCANVLVNCALQLYECKKPIRRSDLGRHYLTEEHQTAVILFIKQFDLQLKKQYQTSAIVDAHIKMETSDLPTQITTAATTTSTVETFNDDSKYFDEMIKLFSDTIYTLNDETIRLSSESLQQSQSIEAADQFLSTIKISIEESKNLVSAMDNNMMFLQQELFSLKQKYDDRQFTSYDGTLIWKITKFQEKMIDAKSERQVSIYSPPFYSSMTGYKMRGRLYLYGDGNARRTHMSLFFVLMRGPHDSILQFPFSYKVTFCLFDQSNKRDHIIDSFRPDVKSNSFQRPRSDMNIASGIPKFASLSIFEKPDNPYVKDDTMFIKIMVDFENMAKTMLPYALSLNPGLPMHTQQWMIQREMERRAQQSQSTTQRTSVSNDPTNH